MYHNKKVLVIGLGISGRSAVRFLLGNGACVQAVDGDQSKIDHDPEVIKLKEAGLMASHEAESIDMNIFDLVVVSPGISQLHPLYQLAKSNGKEIIGEVELACRSIEQPFLAITGTNGKTTVTLLVSHVLNYHGKESLALGNVGVPLTAELTPENQSKIIVAELSSYQLETLDCKVIDAGVILNVTPDHLDRYKSMEEYAKAKFSIQRNLKDNALLYIEDEAMKNYAHLINKENGNVNEGGNRNVLTYGYSPSDYIYCDKEQVYLNQSFAFTLFPKDQGIVSHDVENQLAAFALCHTMGITGTQFKEALSTFKKPAHRIEFVKELNGVSYFDDSKGTNVDAVIRAVNSFKGNVILIAGGVDKGSSYTPWIEVFAGKVKAICVIGQAAEKMKNELSVKFSVEIFPTLEMAVHHSEKIAQKGDTILLSPGCSSFDMFRDYAHRGDEFKRIVNEIKK